MVASMLHDPRPLVLFVCPGNGCRSPMAEGFVNSMLGETVRAASAGLDLKELNPLMVRVMAELGVDLANFEPRTIDAALPPEDEAPALVITMCSQAAESCPNLPAETASHNVEFDDPMSLASEASSLTEDHALPYYRRVRDQIAAWVHSELVGLIDNLVTNAPNSDGTISRAA
jgi:arsenate reductase